MSKIWRGIWLACLVAASPLIIHTNAVQADTQPSVRVTSAVGQGVVRLNAKASGPFSYVIHHPSTDLYYIDLSGVSASSTAAAQVLGTDIVRSYRLEQYQSGDTTVSRLELLLGNGATPQITRQGNDALQIVVSRKNVMDARSESVNGPRMVNAALREPASSSASIRQISVAKNGDAPEVLVMGSGSMNFHASRLSKPSRLVLDFDNERMSAAKKTASNVDPIRDVRAAQYSPEVARVVIDLSKDAAYSVRHVDGGVAVEFSASAPADADAQSAAGSSQSTTPPASDPAPASQSPVSSAATSGAPASQSASSSRAPAQDGANTSSNQGTANSSQAATQPSTPSTSSVNAADSQSSADSSKSSAAVPLAGDAQKPAGFDSTTANQPATQSPATQQPAQPATPQTPAAAPQQAAPPDQSAPTTQNAQSQPQAGATQAAAPAQTVPAAVPQAASAEPAASVPASVVRQDQTGPAKYTGSPISVNLKNVDLQDFFRLVHEISGLNVVVDPSVKGSLTLVLDNVPWDQALDIVLQNNDLDKQLDGNVLRIATKDTLKKEATEQKELAKAQIEAADVVTTTRTLNYAKSGDLVDTIKKFLSPRGDVLSDPRTNTLIISDIPTVLPVVDNLLRELDKKTQQVEIEARVVAANRNFSRELGSQFAFSGSANNGKNIFGGVPVVGTSPVGRFVPPLPAPPVITGTTAPTSTTPTAVNMPLVTNLATSVPTSGVSYAFSTANFALDYVISAAESKGVGKLLSAPKEIVQNNEQATIKQGTKIPIQTVVNNTVSVQFVDAVLELQVTPQITDQGTIFLTVHVENTQIDPSIPRIQGIPALDTQAQDTRVLVSDGQTVMIGGIIVSNQQTNIDEVPFVGSLPIIGQLFRHTTIATSSQELLFFVTPRILPM